MKLKEIMTPDPEVISPDAPLQDAARKMRDLDVGLIPVCDGERVQGMLTDRDITVRATAEGLDPRDAKVSQAMSSDVVYCFVDQDDREAADLMEKHQIRRLIVLNRDKKLAGIVSLGDVAVKAGDDKEVGDTVEKVSQPARPQR